jgi:hypothetical protein
VEAAQFADASLTKGLCSSRRLSRPDDPPNGKGDLACFARRFCKVNAWLGGLAKPAFDNLRVGWAKR